MRIRPVPLVLVTLLATAIAAGVVYRAWIGAQARAIVVLSTALDTPVLSTVVGWATSEPEVTEVDVGGVPATLVRPGGEGPWPMFVFLNGATDLGRDHPDVQRLARGLARAGYAVLVPDVPGLARGELTATTVERTVEIVRAAARHDDSTGRVALFGVSLGATIALLAAERPALAGRVSVVVGIAPYTDLVNVIRLATTATTRDGGRIVPYETRPFLALAVARSVAAGMPAGPARARLVDLLAGVADDDPDPLSSLRGLATGDPAIDAAIALITNRDPDRFPELYAALPSGVRETIELLSPLTRADRLDMPVELATAPLDAYFPAAESRNLARAAPDARVTVTEAFAHVIPRPSLDSPGDLLAFDGWAVRALRAARG